MTKRGLVSFIPLISWFRGKGMGVEGILGVEGRGGRGIKKEWHMGQSIYISRVISYIYFFILAGGVGR